MATGREQSAVVASASIAFFVPGIPATAGSKRGFVVPGKGGAKPRAIVTDSVDTKGKGKHWRVSVQGHAREAYQGPPLSGPLVLTVTFLMPRRAADRRKDGTAKPTAPRWHEVRPDATKLLRAAEDALTGILWHDDAQVVRQVVEKVYADSPGAMVRVEPAS